MNFKMKAAVAALALTASMSASAAIQNTGTGDSSLILTLIDNANSISATFDLGYNYSTFAENLVTAGPNLVWNLAGSADYSAAWSSFVATANLANSHWAIFAGDNTGSTAGSKGMIVTYTTLPATNQTTNEFGTQMGFVDTYIGDSNLLGNHQSVANGANSTVLATEWAGQVYNSDGRVALKGPVTWGSFDQSLGVVKFLSGSTALARVTSDVYANPLGASTFLLTSGGTLTYANVAAVPEADSWAMLLAGLGLMGFIARRRTAA